MPGMRSARRTKRHSEKPGMARTRLVLPRLAPARLAPIEPDRDDAGHETPAFHIAPRGSLDGDRRIGAGLADAARRAAACEPAGGKKGGTQTEGADRSEKARRDTDAGGAAQARDNIQARGNACA